MDSTIQIGFLVAIITAVCEALKYAIGDSRWIPLISVGLGLIGAYFVGGVNFLSTGAGVVLGLSTTGLYGVVKTSILNK